MGISAEGLSSKSWHDLAATDFDLVIHLCELAAASSPPSFSGNPLIVLWSLRDPSAHPGSTSERTELCRRIADRLRLRMVRLAELDFARLSRDQLRHELEMLAEI
jgi:arsenate reductase